MDLLSRRGLPSNSTVSAGSTALMFASVAGDRPLVQLLLSLPDAPVDFISDDGFNGHSLLLPSLIALISNFTFFSLQALMLASARGHAEVVRLLVEVGRAQLNLRDLTGKTAIQHAAYAR